MNREKLIDEAVDRIKAAIQSECTTVIARTDHFTTTVGIQGTLAEKAARAAIRAMGGE